MAETSTGQAASDDANLVNLSELAELMDVSLSTLRALAKEDRFPVEKRASNGVP